MKKPKILVINTGSTSTKLGYFEGTKSLKIEKINHLENPQWDLLNDEAQFDERLNLTRKFAAGKEVHLIMARGGILKPLASGVYEVNEKMLKDLKNAPIQHASNYSAPIAAIIAREMGVRAYIADPVTVDELDAIARYSGHPEFPRRSIFHALNQKAVAKKYAFEKGIPYELLHLIVVHLGGGISIGAHKKGKVVDVNQALDGEGPFSPERSGSLPSGDLVRAAFSGKYAKEQLLKMIVGNGGVKAYLNTSDIKKIIDRNVPDQMKIIDAMIYQVAKYVGEMAVALEGKIDAVILTGGLAYSKYITDNLIKKIGFLSQEIVVFPGEDEMEALAFNGTLLFEKKISPKVYV